MISFLITRQELKNYFQSHGFDFLEFDSLVTIYHKDKRDFIYFPAKRRYTKLYIYFAFYANRNLMLLPWKVEYHRFLFHTHLNRVINKNK